ncbi:MAG: thioredoxin TrxC [Pseudomonas stutzeri]|nr:thioredoxin TrxC [Stutzerimonas stutzeri]
MTDSLIVPCAQCASLNRIPAARVHDAPRCGRCKSEALPDQPFKLQQSQFANQIKGDLPVLVDFWAPWCGPCRSFAPTFAQAANQLHGRCRLAKLDSEANAQLSTQLGIRSIPSLILFRDGREVARQSGAMPLPQLLAWLAQQGVR